MALGKVTITTSAAGVPTFDEPEGVGLFLGEVTSGDGSLKAIGRETDLVALFGIALDLVDTLEAARQNGGPNWKAWAIGHTNVQAWDAVFPIAIPGCDPEFLTPANVRHRRLPGLRDSDGRRLERLPDHRGGHP